ncbi:hypothetical protein GR183_08910 [Stappia sp. GBMRC 2046]|uniref:Uncharacterized protein n=1 Tax=Stappia sediminis TaxID=2692190 RepID=A0A7X3S7S3_9HYPH|nr:hypothetical protein [Stappia sediminis]MXN65024.1 hypothetical protein [Stappia sediminis]
MGIPLPFEAPCQEWRNEEGGGVALPSFFVRQSLTTHNLTISVPMMEQNPCQIVGALIVLYEVSALLETTISDDC